MAITGAGGTHSAAPAAGGETSGVGGSEGGGLDGFAPLEGARNKEQRAEDMWQRFREYVGLEQ